MKKSSTEAKSSALAANMRRLRAGRSIAELRAAMAEKGMKIGAGTLHRAIRGEASNRLESLEKIAEFFETTVDQLLQYEGVDETYWPFSEELQQKVLRLQDEELRQVENIVRGYFEMEPVKISPAVNKSMPISGKESESADTGGTEEGAGIPDDMQVPAPNNNGRSQEHQRSARPKGGRGT